MSVKPETAPKRLVSIFLFGAPLLLLSTCATFILKENDKYDPKQQFNTCRVKLYVNYPHEINPNDWRSCMTKEKNETIQHRIN